MKRLHPKLPLYLLMFVALISLEGKSQSKKSPQKQPNILFCIADDASWQHMSAYGLTKWVKTPGFDRVAKEGLLFTHAYTPNAKCAPSRASILTGRNPWQLEEAGNHNAYFPAKFTTFIEALSRKGYEVGFTGKGWGPGEPGKADGKPRLLTGPEYSDIKMETPTKAISPINYTANFEKFLKDKPHDKPFCFWYGSHEPHRKYEYGSGVAKNKKKLSDIKKVLPFWIDNEQVRNDMLDYGYELEYFDLHLQQMLDVLEKAGQLENTIIVVTSDNGMPFPRVKGHVYEYDNHLPLAIMWKNRIKNPGREIADYVSFIDFAPTFLDIANVSAKESKMQPIQGRSLVDLFDPGTVKFRRDHVLLGREREDIGRPHDEGYPVRAIVKGNFIYSKNYEPERWPSGNPETGYMDTDGSPTKTALLSANRMGRHQDLWQLSFGKKPSEELYRLYEDPWSMKNLADDPAFSNIKLSLKMQMEQELKAEKDPRMFSKGYIFDNYPYAQPRVKNFYERFIKGEKMETGWINDTDFEKPVKKAP